MTLPRKDTVGIVTQKYIMVMFLILSKKDNIEEDGIIPQQDIDFRLQDSFTIQKTLEHTEKISLNAEKCGKIG